MPVSLERFTELMNIEYEIDTNEKERVRCGNDIFKYYFEKRSQLINTALDPTQIIFSANLKEFLNCDVMEDSITSLNKLGWMIFGNELIMNPRKIEISPLYNVCFMQNSIRITQKENRAIKLDVFYGDNRKYHRIDTNQWGKYDTLINLLSDTFGDV